MLDLFLTVLAVVLISGLCSLFEAVLYSVPLSHVETLAAASKAGKRLRGLREKINEPITAILSLNTIANTAGAAVAGALAATALGSEYVVAFSAVFTLLILLFSEILPKTLGVLYARPLSGFIIWPLQILVWTFLPLVWLIGYLTKKIVGGAEESGVSSNDLIVLAKVGFESGAIDKEEASVIQNILSLEDKSVKEIMTPRSVLFFLDARLTVSEAKENDGILAHSRIPVFLNSPDEIIGVVHRNRILTCVAEDRFDVRLEDLTEPVNFVLETSLLDETLKIFLERREQMFVVIDDFGGIAGVITLEDVLEEILGTEIVDEFDPVDDMRELAQRRRDEVLTKSGKRKPSHP